MRLLKLDGTRYRFEDGRMSVEGNFDFVSSIMIEYGIEEMEVEAAVRDLAMRGTDVAMFGISFTFLYSKSERVEHYLSVELKAIESVRQEFRTLAKKDPESIAAKEAFNRLMNLYMSANINGVIYYMNKVAA